MKIQNGMVYLVGAGPGDPTLITLKAIDCLKKATVVLYDYLAHPNLLQYCDKHCELICVGKRKGYHSAKQSEINQLLVDYASQGHCVVRLKGGDPLIFGRGGEEMEMLHQHQIPFEVVPGITSATAVPSFAGIPLTHRNLSRSVAFVTGTLKKGDSNLQIPVADTLVFMMAVTNLDQIVAAILTTNRFTEQTPAALIFHGTVAKEKRVIGTLDTICNLKKQQGIVTPALLVVGDVVPFTNKFCNGANWPLQGKRVVICRPKNQGNEYMAAFSQAGAETLLCPMIEIEANQKEQQSCTAELLKEHTMIFFTSTNAVRLFFQSLYLNGGDARQLAACKVIAIGKQTAAECQKYGINPDLVPLESTSEGILNELSADLSNEKIMIPTSSKASSQLSDECKQRGAAVTRLNLYTTVPTNHMFPEIEHGDIVVFTSSSTAEYFFASKLYKKQAIIALSIGPVTTTTINQYFDGVVLTAESPDIQSLVGVVNDYFSNNI